MTSKEKMTEYQVKQLLEDVETILRLQDKHEEHIRDKKYRGALREVKDKCLLSIMTKSEYESFYSHGGHYKSYHYFISYASPSSNPLGIEDIDNSQVNFTAFNFTRGSFESQKKQEGVSFHSFYAFQADFFNQVYEVLKPYIVHRVRKLYNENGTEEEHYNFLQNRFSIKYESLLLVYDAITDIYRKYQIESKNYLK
jgi:hypothetical protein